MAGGVRTGRRAGRRGTNVRTRQTRAPRKRGDLRGPPRRAKPKGYRPRTRRG